MSNQPHKLRKTLNLLNEACSMEAGAWPWQVYLRVNKCRNHWGAFRESTSGREEADCIVRWDLRRLAHPFAEASFRTRTRICVLQRPTLRLKWQLFNSEIAINRFGLLCRNRGVSEE